MTEEQALEIAFGWCKDCEYPAGTSEYADDHAAARVIREMYRERKKAREQIHEGNDHGR